MRLFQRNGGTNSCFLGIDTRALMMDNFGEMSLNIDHHVHSKYSACCREDYDIADIIKAYTAHERRDDSLLMKYANKLGNRTVFKRLGYLLEVMKLGDVTLIEACHQAISSGTSLLDPSAPRKGRFTRRWNLRINVVLEEG